MKFLKLNSLVEFPVPLPSGALEAAAEGELGLMASCVFVAVVDAGSHPCWVEIDNYWVTLVG